MMKSINRNCIKESANLPLRSVTQIIKNFLMPKKEERYKIIY